MNEWFTVYKSMMRPNKLVNGWLDRWMNERIYE